MGSPFGSIKAYTFLNDFENKKMIEFKSKDIMLNYKILILSIKSLIFYFILNKIITKR